MYPEGVYTMMVHTTCTSEHTKQCLVAIISHFGSRMGQEQHTTLPLYCMVPPSRGRSKLALPTKGWRQNNSIASDIWIVVASLLLLLLLWPIGSHVLASRRCFRNDDFSFSIPACGFCPLRTCAESSSLGKGDGTQNPKY